MSTKCRIVSGQTLADLLTIRERFGDFEADVAWVGDGNNVAQSFVLGAAMVDLDLTVFGSQRAIQKVALVVIQHVVDDERQRILGLHDREWVVEQPPETLAALHERFDSITDDPQYRTLLDLVGLDVTSANRLSRTLRD